MYPDDPTRALLAEDAARRRLCRRAVRPGPKLAARLLAEAACAPPPPRALDLTAEAEALCTALQQAVRRRSWLYFVPSDVPLPVAVPRLLLQCGLLCFVQVSGGAVVQSGGAGPFAAAVRLPKSTLPLRTPCRAQEYLYDRFSPMYTLLGRQCAGYGEELELRS